MRRQSRLVAAVTLAAAMITLTACDKASAPGGEPAPKLSATSQTNAASNKSALPTNGKCLLITTDKAASLLGATPVATASNVTGDGTFTRVDGCTYTSPNGNLGYDVNDFKLGASGAAAFVTQAKTALSANPDVTAFDVPGGGVAWGFTMAVGPKVMGRIEVAKGPYTIGVNATAGDAETATRVSLAAVQILTAAVA